MKYCPYCGSKQLNETVTFCGECGKSLTDQAEDDIPEVEPEEDNYDGYYDDVDPADKDAVRQSVDPETVKKIALIVAGVLLTIVCGILALNFL